VRQGSFFERDADPAKEAAHHRRVCLDAAFGQKPIAQRLQRDVGLFRPRRFQKFTVRVQFPRLVAAHPRRHARSRPLQPFHPFDGGGIAHAKSIPGRPAAHPILANRVEHPVAQILRIWFRHPLPASAQPAG